MNSQSHIAIDLGAGSGRIMLGVWQKNVSQLVEAARFNYAMQPIHGVLCWDYQELLNNLIDAFHVVCSKLDATPQSISCDSWAQDFALLDADGKVCGEIVSYREQRTADMPQQIAAIIPPEELQSRIGRKTAGSFSTLGQLKFLAEHERGLLGGASTLLHIADLIHYELCGNAASNWALASVSQLMNIQTQCWDTEMLEKLQIPTHFLGKIASGKIIGAFVLTKISHRQAKSLTGETILGLILLWLVGWIPYVGWLIKFFALTFGLGGVLLALFNRKDLPAATPPSPVNNEPVQPVNA